MSTTALRARSQDTSALTLQEQETLRDSLERLRTVERAELASEQWRIKSQASVYGAAIRNGGFCFVLSLILLAVDKQPRSVWITAVVVFGFVVVAPRLVFLFTTSGSTGVRFALL